MKNEKMNTIISSRIRLARNFKDVPFAPKMTAEQKNALKNELHDAVKKDNRFALNFIDMQQVSNIQAGSMVEEHLISVEFANAKEGTALLLNNSEQKTLSVMVNEEDHLRMQVLSKGADLQGNYQTACALDDYFDQIKSYAYSDTLGYLTCCPTNIGTGLRASLMMHLPALTESGYINKFVGVITGMGLTVRGLYGEGSQPNGGIYQLSNQVSLGITEQEAVERLLDTAAKLDRNENELRKKYLNNISFKDRIYRSWGILKEARVLSSAEFLNLVSDVRLGAVAGLLAVDTNVLDQLFIKVQPYNIMLFGGEALEVMQRDVKRADLVRETLNVK